MRKRTEIIRNGTQMWEPDSIDSESLKNNSVDFDSSFEMWEKRIVFSFPPYSDPVDTAHQHPCEILDCKKLTFSKKIVHFTAFMTFYLRNCSVADLIQQAVETYAFWNFAD